MRVLAVTSVGTAQGKELDRSFWERSKGLTDQGGKVVRSAIGRRDIGFASRSPALLRAGGPRRRAAARDRLRPGARRPPVRLPDQRPGCRPADECNGSGNALPVSPFYSRSVAADGSGDIFVSDELSNVFKFDPSGTFLTLNDGSTTWGGGGIADLAFGKAANLLYGSEAAGGAIWKISPDTSSPGQIVTNIGGGGNIAVDNSGGSHGGDVYIEEGGSVSRYKPDGTPDEFEAGRAVHLDAGLPYLSANRITGIPEFPTALYTRDIAVDPNGNIYDLLSNPASGQPEVVRFDPSGTFARSYSGAFATSGAAAKLAIDPTSGNLLIFDEFGPDGQTIWELDSSGEVLAQITGASTNIPGGALGGEAQLSVDQSGRILYTGNNSVHIIGPAAPLPRITYAAETGFTRSSIDVHATVDPNGAGDITHCEVQFGKRSPTRPRPSPACRRRRRNSRRRRRSKLTSRSSRATPTTTASWSKPPAGCAAEMTGPSACPPSQASPPAAPPK